MLQSRPRLRNRYFATFTVLILLLAACGGNAEPTTTTVRSTSPDPVEGTTTDTVDLGSGDSAGSAEPEVEDLTIVLIPILSVAPIYAAEIAGYYEDEGLNVTIETGAGGAEYLPRLIQGEVQIAYSAYMAGIQGISEGIDFRFVGHSYNTSVGDDAFVRVLTLPDSGISSVADLEGRTLAINTLNTLGHVMMVAAFERAGIDPATVEIVEVPFPQVAPALERGEIDAAWVGEPFATFAERDLGAVSLSDPNSDLGLILDDPIFFETPGAGFATTGSFADQNPNTIAAFQRALHRANDAVTADPDFAVEVLQSYTEMTEEVIRAVHWPVYGPMPMDRIQEPADLMYELGFIDTLIDFAAYVDPNG